RHPRPPPCGPPFQTQAVQLSSHSSVKYAVRCNLSSHSPSRGTSVDSKGRPATLDGFALGVVELVDPFVELVDAGVPANRVRDLSGGVVVGVECLAQLLGQRAVAVAFDRV